MPSELKVQCDADHAGNVGKRTSTSGWCAFHGGHLIAGGTSRVLSSRQTVIAQKRLRIVKIPRATNSADFYTKGCEKADQDAHMARMGLVVLDETTPQGFKVEVDLKSMSAKSVLKGVLTLLLVRGAEATEEHSVDKGASDFASLITSVVLLRAFFVTLVQEIGRHGGLGSRPGGCPQRVQTTEKGTQTVGYECVLYVSAYGECFHVEVECMGLRQARTTMRKRRCQLCVGVADATPRRGDEQHCIYCLLVTLSVCAAIGPT
eukprot:4541788-Amphidinium_carterae.1